MVGGGGCNRGSKKGSERREEEEDEAKCDDGRRRVRGAGIQIVESNWQELCIGWERKSLKRPMIWEGERARE